MASCAPLKAMRKNREKRGPPDPKLTREGDWRMVLRKTKLQSRKFRLRRTRIMSGTAARTARTYKSSVGVPEANRQAIIALLNARLADSVDLRSQVKWAHWN